MRHSISGKHKESVDLFTGYKRKEGDVLSKDECEYRGHPYIDEPGH